MSVKAQQVTVTTSATRLDITTDPQQRISVLLTNQGSTSIAVGDSTVTTSTGWRLAAGASVSIDMRGSDSLYGVVVSGTATCDVLQQGA